MKPDIPKQCIIKGLLVIFLFFRILTLSSNTFYIDPINGSNSGDGSINYPWHTLEEVIDQLKIESYSYITPYDPDSPQLILKNMGAPVKSGDTLILKSGMHGVIFLQNYINTNYITILGGTNEDPVIKQLQLQACKNWRFDGVSISSEPYGSYINDNLVFLQSHSWQGPIDHIEIRNCDIYSTENPWDNAEDWINNVSDGIYILGDSIEIHNNNIRNIGFGITLSGDYIHVVGNVVKNFSGDGLRVLGSGCLVESNIIKNCYAVDENHDDGIQSFTSGGLIVDNNIIRGNTIINYEDPNQALLGSLQGIGCFDGPFNNWTVENNLIIVDHWHGISFYGALNSKVINNTVIDPSPDIQPGPSWIKIVGIDGGAPEPGNFVQNNVSNQFFINGTMNNNNTSFIDFTDYEENFVDIINNDFHLTTNSELINTADDLAAPPFDLDGIERPQGLHSDIGCYEYTPPNTILAPMPI